MQNYRPARELPHPILSTVTEYLEEGLYGEGISLLLNLLNSGRSFGDLVNPHPAYAPPPHLLSLAATLVVAPSLTTKATTLERIRASNEALRLLKAVNATVGPLNAEFAASFAFATSSNIRRSANIYARRRPAVDAASSEEDDHSDKVDAQAKRPRLRNELANVRAVWSRAQDFWHIVGWAFNCAVAWKKRWERWQLWLSFMVDALEDDWSQREAMCARTNGTASLDHSMRQGLLGGSLIAAYLASAGGRSSRRRILRAIFADGERETVNEFGEVFKNETKERKPRDDDLRKKLDRKKLNIDEGEWADYADKQDDEDVAEDEAMTPGHVTGAIPSDKDTKDDEIKYEGAGTDEKVVPNGTDALGGIEAVILRHRLLSLLERVTSSEPSIFTSHADLIDLITERVSALPTPALMAHISTLPLHQSVGSSHPTPRALLTNLLLPLLSQTSTVLHGVYDPNPSLQTISTHYLPLAASSPAFSANARVALLLERLLLTYQPSPSSSASHDDIHVKSEHPEPKTSHSLDYDSDVISDTERNTTNPLSSRPHPQSKSGFAAAHPAIAAAIHRGISARRARATGLAPHRKKSSSSSEEEWARGIWEAAERRLAKWADLWSHMEDQKDRQSAGSLAARMRAVDREDDGGDEDDAMTGVVGVTATVEGGGAPPWPSSSGLSSPLSSD